VALDIVYCVTYDTDSQSRNVLASPLGEEGHEVAKGWTVVILIMILDVDVTAEGGHNLRGAAPSTLTPKVCPKARHVLPLSLFTLWYNISDYMPASVSPAESRAVK